VDVDGHVAAGDLLEFLAKDIDFRALLPDDDAWAGGRQRDDHLVAHALDIDARERRAPQARGQELAEFDVLGEGLVVALPHVPAGTPFLGDAETRTDRVDFLAHAALTPPLAA
jgi:hypothetical protein